MKRCRETTTQFPARRCACTPWKGRLCRLPLRWTGPRSITSAQPLPRQEGSALGRLREGITAGKWGSGKEEKLLSSAVTTLSRPGSRELFQTEAKLEKNPQEQRSTPAEDKNITPRCLWLWEETWIFLRLNYIILGLSRLNGVQMWNVKATAIMVVDVIV